MSKSKNDRRKKATIGVMTQTRGVIPPPTVKDVVRKKKNNRHEVKRKLKNGDYDV